MSKSIFLIINVAIISAIAIACSEKSRFNNSAGVEDIKEYMPLDTISYDTVLNDPTWSCEYEGFNLGWHTIVKHQLIINDSLSILRTFDGDQLFNKTYTQVNLDKKIAYQLKVAINDIYSNNPSILKNGMPNKKYSGSTVPHYKFHLNLNGEEISDDAYILINMDYGENPLVDEFYVFIKQLREITYRMEHEFYDFPYYRIDEKEIEKNQALGRLYDPESVVQGHL